MSARSAMVGPDARPEQADDTRVRDARFHLEAQRFQPPSRDRRR
jgi:hypothetical protein